jgi:Abhydrolase family
LQLARTGKENSTMGRAAKRKVAPKRVLRLLDLEHSKRTLPSTVGSPDSKRAYEFAVDHFMAWYCSEPRLAFNKTVVLRYRLELEGRRLAPATINLRLAAVRRLAFEAADTGLLSPELAAGIARVKGAKRIGVRLGNWLDCRSEPESARRARCTDPQGSPGPSHFGIDAWLRPVLFTKKLHDAAPLRLTLRAQTRDAAEQWQKTLRARIIELLGPLPEKPSPLQPERLEMRDFAGYTREKFVFESRPGLAVLGYLLTPKTVQAPHPAIVCIPGHGRGVNDIVGIDEEGHDRTAKVGYQYDYAVQVTTR